MFEIQQQPAKLVHLNIRTEKHGEDDVREEAVQTAAMALRLVMSLDAYDYRKCPQHSQGARGFDTLPDDYETGDH